MLWTRRPEHWNFLGVRLGIGRRGVATRSSDVESPDALPDYVDRVDRLRERYGHDRRRPVRRVAAERRARSASPGRTHLAADALRGLGVQLFGLHSPNELVAVALTEPGLGEGARVAEMAAAHHERAQPVPRPARWPTPRPTGAALLSGARGAR